jgi:hypothetical protein
MKEIANAYVDEVSGLVLVRTVDGIYETYVSTKLVESQLRRNRISSDIGRLVAASLNRMIKYLNK